MKNSKPSILTENWHTWNLGGADSESRLRFLKFRPQNTFLGKFGPTKSKLSFCMKIGTNGISGMLVGSYSNTSFLNFQPKSLGKFGPKKSKSSVLPEKWHTWYLEDADSYSDISFLNFKT